MGLGKLKHINICIYQDPYFFCSILYWKPNFGGNLKKKEKVFLESPAGGKAKKAKKKEKLKKGKRGFFRGGVFYF